MKLPGQRLDQAVSSLGLFLSTASLICLIIVFVACTSPSAPESLYFMKVNMTAFPQLKHAANLIRHDVYERSKVGIPDEVISHDNAMGRVANNAAAAAEGVSTTATAAIHDADDKMKEEVQKVTAGLFQYYSCSHPSTTFVLSPVGVSLCTLVMRVPKMVENWQRVSGYHRLARTIVWLYIAAIVTNAFTALAACRKAYSLKGGRLLVVVGLISSLLLLVTTVGSSALYGLIVACVNRTVADVGVQVSIGTQTYVATWLATAFSLGALVIWLIQLYCCCI